MFETLIHYATTQPIALFSWWALILIILGILLSRVISFVQKILTRVYLINPEQTRWNLTLVHAGAWICHVILWICVIVVIMSRVGVPDALLAGLGTVFGAAVGFGSQETIRDIVKGAVHLMEKRFAIGDLVTFSLSGNEYIGTVKSISLRSVTIQTETDGDVFIPQGYVSVIKNYSASSGDFVVSIPIDVDVDVPEALGVFYALAASIKSDNLMIDDENLLSASEKELVKNIKHISVRGISSIDNGYISVQIEGETNPGQQFSAKRIILKLAAHEMNKKNIPLAHFKAVSS